METSQSFAKPAPRTGPVHQQDVPRQNLNHFSRVTHTRGRPVHTFSLLPARGVKREPICVKKNTPDPPHGTTSLNPTGAPVAELLEAEPPSSAHARADIFIRLLPKHQPLLDALHPCLHGWVGIAGQTYGNTVRLCVASHLTDPRNSFLSWIRHVRISRTHVGHSKAEHAMSHVPMWAITTTPQLDTPCASLRSP